MFKKIIGASILASLLVMTAALPVMAKTNSAAHPVPQKLDATCVKNAIEKRDSAISSAVDAYATAIKAALSTRKTALQAAYDLTGKDRRAALLAAWKAYRSSAQQARKDFRQARDAAWKQFYTDNKSCHVVEAEPSGGQGADAGL